MKYFAVFIILWMIAEMAYKAGKVGQPRKDINYTWNDVWAMMIGGTLIISLALRVLGIF